MTVKLFYHNTRIFIFVNFSFQNGHGGAVLWNGVYGTLRDCNFINNTALNGGAIYWNGANGILSNSVFINNTARNGGGVFWQAPNGTLSDSTFKYNTATFDTGGGVDCWVLMVL